MQDLPHEYEVTAMSRSDSNVELASPGLETLESAAPAQFGGPGDRWSPEALLAAAVADCFILTFKAVARGFRIDWIDLTCDVKAILERVDGKTRFTEIFERAVLTVPAGMDEAKATKALERAEKACLVTNSMNAEIHLETEVRVAV